MRRLLLLTCTVVAADTLFYTAIGPLVPVLARTYGLSKAEAEEVCKHKKCVRRADSPGPKPMRAPGTDRPPSGII
jgi:hypothetical protein